MKENIITRKIDNLRRLVIPSEFREELEFKEKQELELSIEYGVLTIKKFYYDDISNRPYTGIVRHLDELNRVTIPIEFVNILQIESGRDMQMHVEDKKIIVL